jgi:extradiol dioxygenase family protein
VAFHVQELSQVANRLDAAGIVYTKSQSGRKALFCRDPDQNALEFVEVV